MNHAPLSSGRPAGTTADPASRFLPGFRRPPSPIRRPGHYLAVAVVGAVLVNLGVGSDPAAQAEAATPESVSVAQQLGLSSDSRPAVRATELEPLEQLAASRSTRVAEQAAARQVQVAADQTELDRRAAEEAARVAAEAAAAAAAARDAAAAEATAAARPGAPAGRAMAAAVDAIARISNSAGPARPQAQAAANAVVSNVPGAAGITIGGTRGSAADPNGHPSGLALDYMAGRSLGDAIAQYHIGHWNELGVEYVIWQQRMLSSPGGSWQPMENRGSATANHMDHVHVNYRR